MSDFDLYGFSRKASMMRVWAEDTDGAAPVGTMLWRVDGSGVDDVIERVWVERTTATQLIVTGGLRFRRADGREVGETRSSLYRYDTPGMDDALRESVRRVEERRRLDELVEACRTVTNISLRWCGRRSSPAFDEQDSAPMRQAVEVIAPRLGLRVERA